MWLSKSCAQQPATKGFGWVFHSPKQWHNSCKTSTQVTFLGQVDKLHHAQEVLARLLAEPGEKEVDEGEMTVREAWRCQEIWATQGQALLRGKGKGTGTGMTSPCQIMGWTWTFVLAPLTNLIWLCQILPFMQKFDALAQMQRPTSFASSGRLSFPTLCPCSFPSSQLPMDKRLFPSMGFVPCVSMGTYVSWNPQKSFVNKPISSTLLADFDTLKVPSCECQDIIETLVLHGLFMTSHTQGCIIYFHTALQHSFECAWNAVYACSNAMNIVHGCWRFVHHNYQVHILMLITHLFFLQTLHYTGKLFKMPSIEV